MNDNWNFKIVDDKVSSIQKFVPMWEWRDIIIDGRAFSFILRQKFGPRSKYISDCELNAIAMESETIENLRRQLKEEADEFNQMS